MPSTSTPSPHVTPPRAPRHDNPAWGPSPPPPGRAGGSAGGGDPVGLLAPQLGGVANRRRALGEAGGQRHQRQLVARTGPLGAADLGRPQLRGEDAEVADRLASLLSPGRDLDPRPHPLEGRTANGAGQGW